MRWVWFALLLLGCGTASPLDTAFAEAARNPHLSSLAVQHDGLLVRERYFHGTGPDTPHDVRSVTKTVTSLLVGIALDRGCLRSVNQTLGELLAADAPTDPAKAAITVQSLLSMSSGLQWDELGSSSAEYNGWALADNQVSYVLARPLVSKPGAVFSYDSGAFHLLSVILTRACAPTADFARDHLFAPLGITRAHQWETDAQGNASGAAGLNLSTRELLRIGDLILNHGGGVVPAAWVEAATSVQVDHGPGLDPATGYGYGLWVVHGPRGDVAFAEGHGGQFIAVDRRTRVVVAATTEWQDLGTAAFQDFDDIYALIARRILPAFD